MLRALGTLVGTAALLAGAAQPPVVELFAEGIVSTPDDEFGAAFTPDGATVYFSKRTPTTNTPPLSFVCVSHRQGSGWGEPEIAPFSGQANDFGAALSSDGQRLVFTSDRLRPGEDPAERRPRLWQVERRNEGWGEAVLVALPESDAVDANPSLARDGTLYFSSTRPGGAGGLDLFRARWVDGRYAEPEPLVAINGPASDGQPCIAADQAFLIFASTGRPDALQGAGAAYPRGDLYISYRTADGWTAPRNLGSRVNTISVESNPALSPDGRFLYFSSDRSAITVPMPRPVTAAEFEATLHSTRSGWSNVYRIPLAAALEGTR